MRLIDADALEARMYHDAFETDSDMQKWDSGCWIRYKMFERALEDAPTIKPEQNAVRNDCEAALNVACDLLNDNVINGHDRDLIFDEIMQDEGSVSSDSWRRYILSHMEVLE